MKRYRTYDLAGYVLGTVDEEQKKAIDSSANRYPELANEIKRMQREKGHLKDHLNQKIQAIQKPASMDFKSIQPRLHQPSRSWIKNKNIQTVLRLGAALVGIILIILGMHQVSIFPRMIQPAIQPVASATPMILPFLSTLFLLLPPVLSAYETPYTPHSSLLVVLLTLMLWLGQGLVWLFTVYVIQEGVTAGVFLLSSSLDLAILLKTISVFILALVWLTLMILSGEYHFRNLGQADSWKSFSRALLISGIVFAVITLMLQL
jgi:hypothetical protein